jgi:hypothetical protein
MSDFLLVIRRGIDIRLDRAAAIMEQATLGPVALRAAIVVAALAGFGVSWPARDLATTAVIVPVVLALGAALAPRSLMPTTAISAIVLGYLYNVHTGAPLVAWRVIAVAAMIYVVHTGASFAAVLPFNAVATPGLFRGYVLRTAAVIGITVVVGLGILAVPTVLGEHRLVSAAVAGMLAMVGVAGYVAYLGSRRR